MLKRRILAIVAICALLFVGCGKIKFSTGMSKDLFMKVDSKKISMDRAYLLLGEQKCSYEGIFDQNVWNEKLLNTSSENYVKNSVSDTVRHLAYLELMADEMKLEISKSEQTKIEMAAKEYYDSLPDDTKKKGDITLSTVEDFYTDLKLAEEVFYIVTQDVDTEVSADEARIISVQYIFFSTIKEDSKNGMVSVDDIDKIKQRKKAESVLEALNGEADFATLANEYSDDSQYVLEFGRGDYAKSFEDAAFELESGMCSGVVETDEGYYIIKCTNDNMDSNYEKQKEKIIFSRRTKMFSAYYDQFTKGIDCEFNSEFWDEISIKNIKSGNGRLYELYEKYIISTQDD